MLIATESPAAAPAWGWAVAPDLRRAEVIDATLRAELGRSFAYVDEVVQARAGAPLPGLASVARRLDRGPVSPWVFCLYSRLVAELSRGDGGDVAGAWREIAAAADAPARPGIVALGDASAPPAWWEQFLVLMDTDRKRSFRPGPPAPEGLAAGQANVREALAVIDALLPDFAAELSIIQSAVVLGIPPPGGRFNGASTFFFWGGSLINAMAPRSLPAMIDVLLHEASHVLLFGLSSGGPLLHNRPEERYTSPVRLDPRPIEGIFHACFVTARVHLAMSRMLDSGALPAGHRADAVARLDINGAAARDSLRVLDEHARPAENGERALAELRRYLDRAA